MVFYGKHHTEEFKQNIKNNLIRGEKISKSKKETQSGIGNNFYGKQHSDETRRKQSEGSKGNLNPSNRVYKIIDPQGNEYILKRWKVFCNERNLPVRIFRKMIKEVIKDYNGWSIIWLNQEK